MIDFKIPSKTFKRTPLNVASSGFKKDLLVLQFALAIIRVSTQDNLVDSDISKRNKDYNLNKKIDRRLLKLDTRLQNTLNEAFKLYGYPLVDWFQANLNKRIGTTLAKASQSIVQLEMMALWVMYVNFSESNRHLDKMFDEYKDEGQYFDLFDLLGQTNSAHLENEMFMMAYELIANIQG